MHYKVMLWAQPRTGYSTSEKFQSKSFVFLLIILIFAHKTTSHYHSEKGTSIVVVNVIEVDIFPPRMLIQVAVNHLVYAIDVHDEGFRVVDKETFKGTAAS